MPLDPEKIKALIAKKNAPKRRGGGGGRKSSRVDDSVRTVETWFALHHRFYDDETREMLHCDNPNCQDPRQKGIMVVEVNAHFMCRYCFLDGYGLENPAQESLTTDA
jgi:hypothetical protein